MSHKVTIRNRIKDPAALATACHRLGLPEPQAGTAQLFCVQASGLIVQLPGWLYPLVVDTTSGELKMDNYAGQWGAPAELEKLLAAYAVEKTRLEADRAGRALTEQWLCNGSIKLTIHTGACVSNSSPVIHVIVTPCGDITVESQGFSPAASSDATRFIEEALGETAA